MLDALLYIRFLHSSPRLFDQLLVALVGEAHELSGSLLFEVPLELGEHKLDRVVAIKNND